MRKVFLDRWTVMHRWWSVRIGALGVIIMAGVPALADQYPNLAPSLLSFFPKHGQQWVPIAGVVLTVVARIVSQAAVIEQLRGMFRKKDSDVPR